jgi:hypothetical protein
MLYTFLMFSSPAINAMRSLEDRPTIVVLDSTSNSQRRYRQLQRRFGQAAPHSLIRFAQ